MKKVFLLGFVFTLLMAAALKAEEKSKINFAITQIGNIVVEGTIPELSKSICFDAGDPEKTTANLVLDMASATTGVNERDEILQAPEWLATETYPEGGFVLESLTRNSVTGKLTLKGETRSISFPVIIDPDTRSVKGDLTIDRRDFKIGDGRWGETEKWVGFEIRISFYITAEPNGGTCDG